LNFVRLQAANDAGNLEDIREFVAPELFAEIKLQLDERGKAIQQTDVVTLNAELLEVVTEPTRHIASVRFSGMIREEAGAPAAPFDEVWNLSKALEGSKGWGGCRYSAAFLTEMLLARPALGFVNHLLTAEPCARERLLGFAGRDSVLAVRKRRSPAGSDQRNGVAGRGHNRRRGDGQYRSA
jgi:hypothetical protein